ncbi:MAG: histidine kinase dimerization/phospho-acceptor domain-containing protein [Planctomycetota bacterium]
MGGLLCALNGAVGWVGLRALDQAFDAKLDERVRTLATLVVQKGPYVELEFADGLMPAYSRSDAPDYFQLWILGEGGGVLERSGSLGDGDLPLPSLATDAPQLAALDLPDGRAGRVISLALPIHEYERESEDGRTANRRDVAVTVATDTHELAAARARMLMWMLAADALFALGSVVVVRLTLARGLAPITAFSERLGQICRPDDAPQLSGLVAPVELQPIAANVEGMLQRLALAFERERRLSSNIAHELRTPIAELRLVAEVALRSEEDVEGLRGTVRDAHAIALEMERTISTLLRLWRDEQAREHGLGQTEFSGALDAALRGAGPIATSRQVTLRRAPSGPCEVSVPERPLALVLANLVQNAAGHARQGTTVEVQVTVEPQALVLLLRNELEDDVDLELGRVFEPFYSSKRGPEHSGLGLPLSRALSEASGMDLRVRREGASFIAELRVPRSDSA